MTSRSDIYISGYLVLSSVVGVGFNEVLASTVVRISSTRRACGGVCPGHAAPDCGPISPLCEPSEKGRGVLGKRIDSREDDGLRLA